MPYYCENFFKPSSFTLYVYVLTLWYDSKVCDKWSIKNQDAKIFKLIFLKTYAIVDRTL